ncbi:MAG: tRNA lysidine(34) synthetase TilS [Chloroflexi bacterium]|nr:tRNA lysidine(34) synthetase TilS [Chloroflexota bacterium]MYC56155.1 tRNA lysidine(34) synthetase TilS [Chloroflexota bacterium]MYH65548.1 tRNA lysidine(34) synthetase TilS [Chloroflexota bacterium]
MPKMENSLDCKLLRELRRALREPGALEDSAALVVAVSGGADSVALLHALRRLQGELGIWLHVASLDHSLRGAAGARDLAFVGALAETWRLSCTLETVDVPRLARGWKIGIEAAARRARYEFLAQAAKQLDCACVAVAHHADDQAETMLMHIARGSGLRGLRGMRPVSPLPGAAQLRLLRPLLGVSRADIEAYCAQHQLAYVTDASNSDTRYRRNYLRSEVIPRLQTLNPALADALNRLSETAAIDDDFIRQQFARLVQPKIHKSPASWRINKADYFSLHVALRRRFLLAAVDELADDALSLRQDLTIDLDAWAGSARVGACRDCGAGIRLRCDYEALIVEKSGASPEAGRYRLIPRDTDIKLAAGQTVSLAGIRLRIVSDLEAGQRFNLQLPAQSELCLRTRRPGDRFQPKGMGGSSRKLKDWMIDRKIPRLLREQIPLLCANNAIVAICLADTWHLAEVSIPVGAPRITTLFD